MKKTLGFALVLAVFAAAGCSGGEPQGDVAPPDVKVEKAGTGNGPQPSTGVPAPATQPAGAKTSTE